MLSSRNFRRKIFATFMATLLMLPNGMIGAFAANEDLVHNTPTDVTGSDFAAALDKKADALNDDGQYQVSVKVQGKKTINPEKADIVFVLDNSNSMQGNVSKANDAIRNFMKVLVPDPITNTNPDIRFGLVVYGTDIRSTKNLTSNKNTISVALPDEVAGGAHGATNTQLGLQKGQSLFDSVNSKKYIVLLTDGVPTYSDKVTGTTSTADPIPKYGDSHSGTYGNRMANSYDTSSRKGSGGNYKLNSWGSAGQYTVDGITVMDNGFATISQARSIKSSDIEIFGVAMALTSSDQGISAANSKNVIKDISSPGKFFDVTDMSGLGAVLEQIAHTVGASISDGRLIDPMSTYVDIVKSGAGTSFVEGVDYSITMTGGAPKPLVTWNDSTKQIQITDIDLGENQSFTLTYKVQLKDQYKDGNWYDLNGVTKVYKSPEDQAGKEINVPKGRVYKGTVELTKKFNGKVPVDGKNEYGTPVTPM